MRWAVGILLVLILIGIAIIIANRPVDDGLGEFPHAFLDKAGYDAGEITFCVGPVAMPPPPPPGMLPAWICEDPGFADAQGRRWLFPMPTSGAGEPQPPMHPLLKRRPDSASCRLYLSDEAKAKLEAFRAKVSR